MTNDTSQLSEKQRTVLRLIAAGRTAASAARCVGHHRSVVSRWKQRSPEFRAAFEEAREQAESRVPRPSDTDDPHETARRTLLDIAGDSASAPTARVAACRALADMHHPVAESEARAMSEHEAVQEVCEALMSASRMAARGNLPETAIDGLMVAVSEASVILLEALADSFDPEAVEQEVRERMRTAFASHRRR